MLHNIDTGTFRPGCGSGYGLDPDSMGCLDPDSESGSGSRGKKKKKMKKNQNLYIKIFSIY
jgi:hypothetical protein